MKKTLLILFTVISCITFAQQQSISTQGTEFWAVFMQNFNHSTGTSALELSILVSAKRACSVTLNNPNSTWTTTVNVAAGSLQRVTIPHAQGYLETTTASPTNRCIRISSTDTISVYSSNFASATFDAANILPTQALGNEYIIQCFPPVINQSEFSITAIENNTIIDITPSVSINSGTTHSANSTFSVTLNRGQSVFMKSTSTGAAGDLSGTHIVARDCKKIAVFNGDCSTNVPSDEFADHIYEQAFPVNSWGKMFVVTNSIYNSSGTGRTKDIIRVTASANNTTVKKNGTILATINEGQTYQFQITNTERSAFVETSNPAAVYLYLVSKAQGGSEYGDPSMVWIAPLEQKIDEIVFNTFYPTISASQVPNNHFVNIVTETANTGQIRLDGSAVTGWAAVNGNSTYSYVRKNIAHSAHTISGGNGFIAHVYGIGNAVSYAYTVGSMATNLSERMYINGIESTDASVSGMFCTGEAIEFSSEVDYDYNNIVWNFNDGSPNETGNTVSHTFENEGDYTVNMQVNTTTVGCSSFSNAVNFNVSIGHPWETELTTEANYGETITVQGYTFTARRDTTIIGNYTSLNGCDSTVINHVEISTINTTIDADICQGQTYNLNGFNESTTGSYIHFLTSAANTDSIVTLNLTVRENPTATIIGNYALCNGEVSLMAGGGTSYQWSTGNNTSALVATTSGQYTVTVTNEYGCTDTAQRTISPEVQINITYDPIACYGGTTSVAINATGGISPYTGIETVELGACTQSFNVTDSEGCTSRQTITITEPDSLTHTSTSTDAHCNDNFGTVEITPNGGTAPYSIRWSDGSTSFSNNRVRPNILYRYTITDSHNCTNTDTVEVMQEPPIALNITHTDISCFNGNNGSITVSSVSNGHSPYTYNWSNGQTEATASNLTAGSYVLTVSDDHSCTVTAAVSLQNPAAITIDGSVKNASCIGMCDGRIIVIAHGGTPEYTYSWNSGFTENVLTNLCYGNYTITVSDANGCKQTNTFSIIQPESMSLTATTSDASCFGGNDGTITVSVEGGTAPFSYSLNEFMNNSITSRTMQNVTSGPHTVYVMDSKGCTAQINVNIGAPDMLAINYETVSTSCKEATDGKIIINISGGTAPYYLTSKDYTNKPLGEKNTISDLHADTYHFIITDENGCSYSLKNIYVPENATDCLHIPNVFTPNGDGINDVWELQHIEMYPDAKIVVFNRWGQKLYVGDGTSEYWDGTFNGHLVPAGTYTYIINIGEERQPYTGSLSILY